MIRRLRIIVGMWEVLILVYNVALARLTATRLHGPRSEYWLQDDLDWGWSWSGLAARLMSHVQQAREAAEGGWENKPKHMSIANLDTVTPEGDRAGGRSRFIQSTRIISR
jgi:hypothetical protein